MVSVEMTSRPYVNTWCTRFQSIYQIIVPMFPCPMAEHTCILLSWIYLLSIICFIIVNNPYLFIPHSIALHEITSHAHSCINHQIILYHFGQLSAKFEQCFLICSTGRLTGHKPRIVCWIHHQKADRLVWVPHYSAVCCPTDQSPRGSTLGGAQLSCATILQYTVATPLCAM